MACNYLLSYPGFDEKFKINNDASVIQLEAVIGQKGKPIAIYSIKLTGA